MRNSFLAKYLSKIFSNIVNLGSGFAVTFFSSRALGPAQYGSFSFLTDFFTQIFGLLDCGSSSALYTKLSQRPNEINLIKFYWKFALVLNTIILFFIFGTSVSGFYDYFFHSEPFKYIYFAFFYASLVWMNAIFIKILDAVGLTVYLEIFKICHAFFKFMSIGLLFFLNLITLDYFFIFHFISLSVLNLGLFIILKRHHRTFTADKNNYVEEFKTFCAPLVIQTVVGTVCLILDRWLLQKFSGASEQGYFALSAQLGAICFLFTESLSPLFYREIAIHSAQDNQDRIGQLIIRFVPTLFLVSAYFAIFCSVNSETITMIIAGEKFKNAGVTASIMFLYPIHQTYGQLIGSLFLATGQTRLYRNIGTFFLCSGVIITFFLIAPKEYYGMDLKASGLAFKYVVLQLLTANALLFYFIRNLKVSYGVLIRHQVYVFIALFLAAIFVKSATNLLFINQYIQFLINGFIYTVCIALLIYWDLGRGLLIPDKDVRELIAFRVQQLLNKIKFS